MSGQPPPPPPLPPVPPGTGGTQAPPVTNGMAIGSMIAGTIGVVLFWTIVPSIVLGIVALVLGAIAKGRANQGAPNGTMAVAGLVLGIVAIVGSIAMIFIVLPTTRVEEISIEVGAVLVRR